MKKVGIITIIDNENCGNRLQNFAMQKILQDLGFEAVTIRNEKLLNSPENFFCNNLRFGKKVLISAKNRKKMTPFSSFNKNISFTKKIYTCKNKSLNKRFDYFIAGSDQIWKPTRKRLSYMDLLGFADNDKRISYAASFGISSIDKNAKEKLQKELPNFKAISVRETIGKENIHEATGIENVAVVLDPTMLVDKTTWTSLERKPALLSKNSSYLLAYFLGEGHKKEAQQYCKKHNLEYIDFYEASKNYGPSEFLYLINHSKIVVTDSFHGSVFSIIFNRPFLVCRRIESAENNDMLSRIDTLLQTFGLEEQYMCKTLEKSNLTIDYEKVNRILKRQQTNSLDFLKDALDITEKDNG